MSDHSSEGDTMVPRQSEYFGYPLTAERGVCVGDNVPPTIFNIVIDAVIRNWEHVHIPVPLEEVSLFYIDDGAISGTDAGRLPAGLDVITSGFESFGLVMNATKTKYMVMSGGKYRVQQSMIAYNRRATGEGATSRERSSAKVLYNQCGTKVGRNYFKKHQTTKKCLTYVPPTDDRKRVQREKIDVTPRREPEQYTMSIPRGFQGDVQCPVAGCHLIITGNKPSQRKLIRKHFRDRHIQDSIMIEEEGQLPHCNRCGLFMNNATSPGHQGTADCGKYYTTRREPYFRAQHQIEAEEVTFQIAGAEIECCVSSFRYLGTILDENDNDSHALTCQLARARARWGRIAHVVLQSDGVKPRLMGYFYKAVVQAIFLYGMETWVLMNFQLRQLPSFHAIVTRYSTHSSLYSNCHCKLTISKESGGKAIYYFSAEPPLSDSASMSNVV